MNPLVAGIFNKQIQDSVFRYTGKKYQICNITENKKGMHAAALFEGYLGDAMTRYDVFVKMGTNPYSPEQFQTEAWELNYIRSYSTLRTPEVIDVIVEDNKVLLVMEAVHAITPQSNRDWEIVAEGLASLHRVTSDKCGLERPTYLGIFRQDNTFKNTWAEFFGECRLRDSMNIAIQSGNMTNEACNAIEKLIERLPQIAPEPECFSLLHGDPWVANWLFTGREVVAIDCSLYYGNREIDLTTTELFKPMPPIFLEAYKAVYPLEPGYEERRDLWKINQWLGHVTLFGDKYMGILMDAVNKYL